MALSTNYSWAEPDNSSLVKNGASDIRALGDAIDTSVWNVGYGQAAKNKLINGDFTINQRAFTTSSTDDVFSFDRWKIRQATGTVSATAQTFTVGAAPVVGYESKNYISLSASGQTAAGAQLGIQQSIEGVRTFAAQTATLSFWAKAASGTPKIALELQQTFGSGGSPSASVNTYGGQVTISTSWVRYSLTVNVPSISGKTIGNDNNDALIPKLYFSAGTDFNARTGSLGIQSNTFDIWGVQAEYGAKMTPFQTASGNSIQGELAMCQRYFNRIGGTANGYPTTGGVTTGSGQDFRIPISFPSTMRIAPTITKNGTWEVNRVGQPSAVYIGTQGFSINVTSDATGTFYCIPNTTDDYFDCSGEL